MVTTCGKVYQTMLNASVTMHPHGHTKVSSDCSWKLACPDPGRGRALSVLLLARIVKREAVVPGGMHARCGIACWIGHSGQTRCPESSLQTALLVDAPPQGTTKGMHRNTSDLPLHTVARHGQRQTLTYQLQ
jgi:hypothetical protein